MTRGRGLPPERAQRVAVNVAKFAADLARFATVGLDSAILMTGQCPTVDGGWDV